MFKILLLIAVCALTSCGGVQVSERVKLPRAPTVPVSWAKNPGDLKGGIQSIYGKTCLGTFMTIDQLGVQSRFAITLRSDRAGAEMRVPDEASYAEAKVMLGKYGVRIHSTRVDLNTFIIGTVMSRVALRLVYLGSDALAVQYIKDGYYRGIHARFTCK